MHNKDETNPRRKQQIIHINPTVQCTDKQPICSKHKLTFCLNATVLMYLKHVIKTTVAFALMLLTTN